MKKFHFTLEKARSWRRLRMEQEESKLDLLQSELRVLGLRRTRLDQQVDHDMRRAAYSPALPAEELSHLAYLGTYAREERRRMAGREALLKSEIERQRDAVRQARQEYEVLDRLRDKQYQDWNQEWSREQETQIGELAIARWNRSQRGTGPEKG